MSLAKPLMPFKLPITGQPVPTSAVPPSFTLPSVTPSFGPLPPASDSFQRQAPIPSNTTWQPPSSVAPALLPTRSNSVFQPNGVGAINPADSSAPVFINRLKAMLRSGEAQVFAMNMRTFGAEDINHDGVISPNLGESGTFLRAEQKLDALKSMGFNVLHVLPILPVGRLNRLGTAGSVYAPSSYQQINPELNVPGNGLNVFQEFQHFIQEAHKRGIHVMVDVPSCASEDLAEAHPELVAVDREGNRRTPGTWIDVVAFENNLAFQDYMEPFFQMMDEAGVDGFRCDIGRFRTDAFWQHFISKIPREGLVW